MPNAPLHKRADHFAAAHKPKAVSHTKAKESATKIYEHSTDLEVLLRHKVYPKTVGEINDVQLGLNDVRAHVKGSLKKKDLRKAQWKGVSESHFGLGLFLGFIAGVLAAFFLSQFLALPLSDVLPRSPKPVVDSTRGSR